MKSSELETLNRKQLQHLAKENGIKANLKTVELIEKLSLHFASVSVSGQDKDTQGAVGVVGVVGVVGSEIIDTLSGKNLEKDKLVAVTDSEAKDDDADGKVTTTKAQSLCQPPTQTKPQQETESQPIIPGIVNVTENTAEEKEKENHVETPIPTTPTKDAAQRKKIEKNALKRRQVESDNDHDHNYQDEPVEPIPEGTKSLDRGYSMKRAKNDFVESTGIPKSRFHGKMRKTFSKTDGMLFSGKRFPIPNPNPNPTLPCPLPSKDKPEPEFTFECPKKTCFNLEESLKRELKYKPHVGPLKPFKI